MTSAAAASASILKAVNTPYSVDGVSYSGDEPVLESPLRLATAGASALGAVALAADAVWQARGGSAQNISVSLKHGGAAVRTHDFLRVDGEKVHEQFRGLSGFYRCAGDRWLRTHCNFKHHEAALLDVLGCAADKDAVSDACAARNAHDLEEKTLDAGGCAYMVRTLDEWNAHPQAAALQSLPVLEIIKIGDAPAKPLPPGDRPLDGIRALDLTRIIAGPMIGRTLAEHGAEVLRIASPNLPFIAPLVIDTGFGKRSAFVDLDTDHGVADMHRLLGDADIFVQGYRQGSLAGRHFGPEDIAARYPGTVYVSLSAWSHLGPWSHRRGYDTLLQSATGWADELGGPDTPKLQPAQAIDYVSGYLGAFGAMEALRRRATEGGTWLVRLSLAQTRHWIDGLGRIEPARGPDHGVEDILQETDSAFGVIRHLGHTVRMSETPPRWETPPVPLGSNEAVWIP